jgi:hypothetical protein
LFDIDRETITATVADLLGTPIRIKRSAMLCRRLGGLAAPEERWCRFVSNGLIADPWLSVSDANPWLARVAGDPLCRLPVTANLRSIQTKWLLLQSPDPDSQAAVVTHAKQRVTSKNGTKERD